MIAQCPGCAFLIPADKDQRLPPWCPKCGSDLKGRPQQQATQAVAQEAPPTLLEVSGTTLVVAPPAPLPVFVPPESFSTPADGKRPIPPWVWIFVAGCGAIPVVTLGGAVPAIIGFLSASGCVTVARSRDVPTPAQVALCVLITVAAWFVTALAIGGLALLMFRAGVR